MAKSLKLGYKSVTCNFIKLEKTKEKKITVYYEILKTIGQEAGAGLYFDNLLAFRMPSGRGETFRTDTSTRCLIIICGSRWEHDAF